MRPESRSAVLGTTTALLLSMWVCKMCRCRVNVLLPTAARFNQSLCDWLMCEKLSSSLSVCNLPLKSSRRRRRRVVESNFGTFGKCKTADLGQHNPYWDQWTTQSVQWSIQHTVNMQFGTLLLSFVGTWKFRWASPSLWWQLLFTRPIKVPLSF